VEDEAEDAAEDPVESTRTTLEKEKLPLEAEPTPRGPADVGGTPADTMEVISQKLVSPADAKISFEIQAADHVEKAPDGQSEAKLVMAKRPSMETSKISEAKQDSSGPPKSLDDSKKSVSIGDRIEGIRACLEARMGTNRFQKLYKSLTKDDSMVNNLSGSSVSWPRDSSMFLPEDIDEAFVGAGDGGSDDVNSLIPLVAKLVACEQSYFS